MAQWLMHWTSVPCVLCFIPIEICVGCFSALILLVGCSVGFLLAKTCFRQT